tara:strand:+ start:3275 stop:3520 length:246 start_codon:yes stop_codon:yes gene_type:complete
MIDVVSILEEYCDTVEKQPENKFSCELHTEYLVQLIQRLNMVSYCVNRMSYIGENRDICSIEVAEKDLELFDDYPDDLYYS